jgi:hypothetical protein
MLATKPAGASTVTSPGASPPYSLAAATTHMMWACALATARVTVASTARSLELWSHLLRAPSGLADRGAAAPCASGGTASPEHAASPAAPQGKASAATAPADTTPFASYRSSGGHAAAQVTVSE